MNKTADDFCILFMAIKASISKANKHNFVPKITGDAVDFFNNIVCLMNKFSYCNDSVKVVLTNLLLRKYSSDNVAYNKWVQENKHYQKIEISESGTIVIESFHESTTSQKIQTSYL